MDPETRRIYENLWADGDRQRQTQAYYDILAATDQPVDWSYEVWDELLANLTHKDNHRRSIAAQVISSLAKSDPEQRILVDFDALLAVTRDKAFVTARHALQSLWKVGAAGKPQQERYLAELERRFRESAAEKNSTMIRFDIIQSLWNVYNINGDETLRQKAREWIESETDPKYRKKYLRLWRDEVK